MPATEGPGVVDTAAVNRPKRVRTGCLTCRERHLKCDEALPNCHNCQKSSRVCKRGVRLNFIDTTVKSHPLLPPTGSWKVKFQDESREIASEYKGGLGRYSQVEQIVTPPREPPAFDFPPRSMVLEPTINNDNIALPSIQPLGVFSNGEMLPREEHGQNHSGPAHSHQPLPGESSFLAPPSISNNNVEQILTPPHDTRDCLNSPEELLFMQVFVEEVGIWMDSLDPLKHFSRLLPFHALGDPMLLNAFLACGARHLSLVNPIYTEDKALYYYDTATTQLLQSLHNPNRNAVVCATTAVILNVYEIMSERATQRMNHIAGARALIKECGWDATSTGIGAACFWLNVGMEILSCLHFNWHSAWDPDQWGLDMNFQREIEPGKEEIWAYRMLYIVGKVSNFRAAQPRFKEATSQEDQMLLESRMAEWEKLKGLCDEWNASIPRNMHPMGYLYPSQTTSKSVFPEIWIIKRSTITARLFYHTAVCLLHQVHPIISADSEQMQQVQLDHAHQICGIVAHVKDRGVASVALRSLAVAGECLVLHRERQEVLDIFARVRKETGWRVEFILKELKTKWGWQMDDSQQQIPRQQSSLQFVQPSSLLPPPAPPQPQQVSMPAGILNPLLRAADFSLPNHPYKQDYQPPNQQQQQQQQEQNQFSHLYL